MFRKNRNGFTLIELLVVIAILGIMMGLAMVSWRDIQMKTRDTRRISDIASLQKALAMYQIQHAVYPLSSVAIQIDGSDSLSQELIAEKILTNSVKDPMNNFSGGVNYIYTYQSAGASYSINYCLETDYIQGRIKGCGNEATP